MNRSSFPFRLPATGRWPEWPFRPLSLVLALLCFLKQADAQLLSIAPAFPADTGSITIIVDCSLGNQGLFNYASTSDVYVHTGVITDQSSGQSDWRYVKFNQNFNQPNPSLAATSLGNNKYSFTIPGARAWYGVPAGEKILGIAILFRNGNGSQVQRNTDGSDMYIHIYDQGLAAKFTQPPFQPTYIPALQPLTRTIGDTLSVSFQSNKLAALSISFNGAQIATAASADSLHTTLHINTTGTQQVIAIANDGTTSLADTLSFFVASDVNIAPLPTGMGEGINYEPGDTAVTLVLYAPHKNKILVNGDFSNWTLQARYQMNRTPDSDYYWLHIGNLRAGTEYAYQYVIDDTLILADYNTEKVLDKNVDPQIPSATYPNLRTFPAQASGSLASVIQTGQQPYAWQITNFKRPTKQQLVIYELLLRDFISPSNWQALIDTLGYLKRLGVNAVEVMPFNNFEGASSWGYNPNFYFAPDKVYGTPTALKQFIDACHGQGMAVIMDMVLNHSFGSSPMVQMYFDNSKGVPAANNPWFNQYPTHPDNVGYQFNHESPATKTFTQRVIAWWLTNYHIDGYRFDLAKGFTQKRSCDSLGNNCDMGAWSAYDASRIAIWDTIYKQQQQIAPGSYCILEMFADNSEQQVEANTGMMLWGNMNYNFNQATMGYGPTPTDPSWDLSGGLYTNLGWSQPGLVVYQESHDEERLMYKNEQYGNSSGSYNVKDIPTGLSRNGMAAAFWSMLPGPKMLWEFGELGYDHSINTCSAGNVDGSGNCRTDPKPAGWPLLADTNRARLHDIYAAMLRLRARYPDLALPNSLQSSLTGAFKSLQLTTDSLSLTLIGNFDVVTSTGTVSFPSAGEWYNYLGKDSIRATGSPQSITLNPGQYAVYVNRNLTDTGKATPPGGGMNYQQDPTLARVCPNPVVGGSSTVRFKLTGAAITTLTLIDGMGAVMGTANMGLLPPGEYDLPLAQLAPNIAGLTAGYYVLKLQRNGQNTNIPFVVIKR